VCFTTGCFFFCCCFIPLFWTSNHVFLDAEYYFHHLSCLQEWKKFLLRPSNGLRDHNEEALAYLKAMQVSSSKDHLGNAAQLLEQSDMWQASEKLQNWFQIEWLLKAEVSRFCCNFKLFVFVLLYESCYIHILFHLCHHELTNTRFLFKNA